jgi:hypothetical protein
LKEALHNKKHGISEHIHHPFHHGEDSKLTKEEIKFQYGYDNDIDPEKGPETTEEVRQMDPGAPPNLKTSDESVSPTLPKP